MRLRKTSISRLIALILLIRIENDIKRDTIRLQELISKFCFRYLGQTTVYTLLPQVCNDFALLMEETRSEKRAPKAVIQIHTNAVQITYCPSSPIGVKSKDISPQHLSALLTHKGGSPKRRPKSDYICQYHQAERKENELVNHSKKERCKSEHMNHGVGNHNNLDVQYESNHTMNHYSCCALAREEDSILPPVIPHPELLMLSEIAYCVTLPNSRLFVLTSRGTKGLICRVFLFSKPQKAEEIKIDLANHFRSALAS